MGKLRKQAIRAAFREVVFTRDGYRCRVCGSADSELDAHHISDRTTMPGGGYVKEKIVEHGIPCATLVDCRLCSQARRDYQTISPTHMDSFANAGLNTFQDSKRRF